MSCGAVLSIVLLCSIDYVKVFATSHRKGSYGSVGGTVKRLALRVSLQRPSEKQIRSPTALFQFVTENLMGILFEFVNAKEIIKKIHMLDKRLLKTVTFVSTVKHQTFTLLTEKKEKAYHPKILRSFLSDSCQSFK